MGFVIQLRLKEKRKKGKHTVLLPLRAGICASRGCSLACVEQVCASQGTVNLLKVKIGCMPHADRREVIE